MNRRDDELWQRMVRDDKARAHELADAERRLAGTATPPHPAPAPAYLARVLVRPVRTRRPRLLAALGGLVLVAAGSSLPAFIGTKAFYPRAEVAALYPDDYGLALAEAADPGLPTARLRQVVGHLDACCAALARRIDACATSPDAALAARARAIGTELVEVLTHGQPTWERLSNERFLAALRGVGRDGQGTIAALEELRAVALPGFAAVHALTSAGIEPTGGTPPVARLKQRLRHATTPR